MSCYSSIPHLIRKEGIGISKGQGLYRDDALHPSKKLYITLPLPPSINHMYYNTKFGGKRLTHKAEDYVRISTSLINSAIDEQKWIKQSKSTWYYVDLIFFMPDRRIRDSHNMLKLLLDVMQGAGVFENDYYACPRILGVEYDKLNPRLIVVVRTQSKDDRQRALRIAGL